METIVLIAFSLPLLQTFYLFFDFIMFWVFALCSWMIWHLNILIGVPFPSKSAQLRCDLLVKIEVDETKSERPGSDSGYWKQKHDDLKQKNEVFDKTVVLRQAFSDFEKTKEFVVMDKEIKKEV